MPPPRNVLIALFRADLRMHDHPILSQCAPNNSKLSEVTHVLPLYIFDQQFIEVGGLPSMSKGPGPGSQGAKSRVGKFWRTGAHRVRFQTRSVYDLRDNLRKAGSDLSIWAGQPHVILPRLVTALKEQGDRVHGVWMGKEPYTEEKTVVDRIQRALAGKDFDIPIKTFHYRSLVHPDDLGFKIKDLPDVYTQFRKRVEGVDMYSDPLPAPTKLKPFPDVPALGPESGALHIDLGEDELVKALLSPLEKDPDPIPIPTDDVSSSSISALPFRGGETEALSRLEHYFAGGSSSPAASYKQTRNGMLGADYSTKFSAALAHGLLSPRLIAQRAEEMDKSNGHRPNDKAGGYWILFELLWRDYFFFVSFKFGSKLYTIEGLESELDSKEAQRKAREWKSPKSLDDKEEPFVRWASATTGVPLIDANMKELALTGFMSNRGRQNVASLLTKDLYIDWRLGAEWFESMLVDHDPSSNWGNWQYVAGVGNDPRSSRQFNPIKQGKDYDPKAEYIKTWLPVLKDLPANDAHHPWVGGNVPEGYPAKPVTEHGSWKGHYGHRKGGGGGGSGSGSGGRGRGGYNGRGRNGGRGVSRGGRGGRGGQEGHRGGQGVY